MRNPTKEEQELLDKVMEYAEPRQILRLGLWDIFCPWKRDALLENLKAGKSWMCSYNDAKKTKRK